MNCYLRYDVLAHNDMKNLAVLHPKARFTLALNNIVDASMWMPPHSLP